jgi:A/G-specific adenine glycosylase
MPLSLQGTVIDSLQEWFLANRCDLPWRRDRQPYSVWISEIMLQQTVRTTVVHYFERWMKRYPDISILAISDQTEVLRLWEGLGYYRRALNILRSAQIMQKYFRGRLPSEYEDLVSLPGIGDYTACAILSLGYGKPYPVLDANIRRVGQRLFAWRQWKSQHEKLLRSLLQKLIGDHEPGSFNEAFMELGQTVCLSSTPKCFVCPVQAGCRSFLEGSQDSIPEKKTRKVTEKTTLLLILHRNRRLWLRESQEGLFKGLWLFPGFEVTGVEELPSFETHNNPLPVDLPGMIPGKAFENIMSIAGMKIRYHRYTRYKDKLIPFLCHVNSPDLDSSIFNNGRWLDKTALKSIPVPSVYREIIAEVQQHLDA